MKHIKQIFVGRRESDFKSFYWERVAYSKLLRFLSLTHGTSCGNLKIRGLCVAFPLFLFWKKLWRFKFKESMLSVEQKWSSRKKKTCIFCNICFSQFFLNTLFLPTIRRHVMKIVTKFNLLFSRVYGALNLGL